MLHTCDRASLRNGKCKGLCHVPPATVTTEFPAIAGRHIHELLMMALEANCSETSRSSGSGKAETVSHR